MDATDGTMSSSTAIGEKLHQGSLKNCASQLELTSCLRSIIQDAMVTFSLHYVSYWNEWKNFDILTNEYRTRETEQLFHRTLCLIPVLPFEELILHRGDIARKARDLQAGVNLHVQFPFFSLLSASLVQALECTLQKNVNNISPNQPIFAQNPQNLLQETMSFLEEESVDTSIALDTLVSVMDQEPHNSTMLYDRYLSQYITWKLCIPLDSVAAKWFRDALKDDSAGETRNLLWVHVCARRYEMELLRVASAEGARLQESRGNALPNPYPQTNSFEISSAFALKLEGTKLVDKSVTWFFT